MGNCYRYIIGIDSSNVYEFENLISKLEQDRSNQKSSNNIWKMIKRLLSIIWFISCISIFIIEAFTFSWILYWIVTKNNIFIDTGNVLLNWEERLFTNIN